MRIGIDFAKCNHAEEKINALRIAIEREMKKVIFEDNPNYDTFAIVVNPWELVQASKIIVRILGEK